MANEIKIPPEQLRAKGNDFVNKGNSMEGDLNELKKSMGAILAASSGDFQKAAHKVNEQVGKNLMEAIRKIRDFGEDCKKAADGIEAADKNAAKGIRNQ